MNLAKEARDKAQAKWPGASVHSRGSGWIKHQHPTDENKFILDSHIGPIHYGADNEIDTAWIADTTDGFTHAMTANSFTTRVRADQFNAGDIFRFEKDGETLVFDPQSINWIDENTSRQQIAIKQNVTGSFDDDTVSFSAAYGAGRHFQYQNQTIRLQKLITIDNDTDLPEPTVQGNEIWFEAEFSLSLSSGINFWIDGVEWARSNGVRVQTADRIEIRDSATGTQVLWWLDYPRAFDSSGGNETIGQMEVRRQGGPSSLFICVRIPKTWIDAAVFPIYIDPTIDDQIGASADDADERMAGANFSSTDANLVVSSHTTSTSRWVAGTRFPSIALDGTETIDDGTYWEGYSYNTTVDDFNTDIYAHDVDNSVDFSSDADVYTRYNTARTTASASLVSLAAGAGVWVGSSVEIKTVIQEIIDRAGWSSGNAITILVAGKNDATYVGNFRSYDGDSGNAPKLHIEYTAAGGTIIPLVMHHFRQQGIT
jgi:hypothetical protein